MATFHRITLKHGKEEALLRYHPWVFSGAIHRIEGEPSEGDIVEVYSSHNEFLGTGHYNQGSINVRIFSFEQTKCDRAFWKKKLENALNYRKLLGLFESKDTNAYRLVFGEGDGLPGLIIDFYNGTAVIQCHTYGMYLLHQQFAEIISELYNEKIHSIYLKCEETLPKKFNGQIHNAYLLKKEKENTITENDCQYFVDWENGQKTGFFLDQRENRRTLMPFCKNKTVLNTFCYTGSFSVCALKAGASLVHSVDSSARAIELTEKNIDLNGFSSQGHLSFRSDVIEYLKNDDNTYDIIILDPPAFAKHLKTKHSAVQGYKRLNEAAMQKIRKGGFLFTFSCSQVVDAVLFRSTVIAAAIQSKREIRITGTLTQPPDHPVSAFHPEGEYLKGLILQIE